MEQKKIGRRNLTVNCVIGVIFLVIGEPFMASCSAGLVAAVISCFAFILFPMYASYFFVVCNVVVVLVSGAICGAVIKKVLNKKIVALCSSLCFLFCKAFCIFVGVLSRRFEIPLESLQEFDAMVMQGMGGFIYELLLSSTFFVLFICLKLFIIDKRIEDD